MEKRSNEISLGYGTQRTDFQNKSQRQISGNDPLRYKAYVQDRIEQTQKDRYTRKMLKDRNTRQMYDK